MALNINQLPLELLDMVFDHLKLPHQITASQVCLLWEAIFNNRIKVPSKRYKRFYSSHGAVPQRIHRLLALNESWFVDHEDPATDDAIDYILFTRGSDKAQTTLSFTIKNFEIDQYMVQIWKNNLHGWKRKTINITDHSILDEPLFSNDTIVAMEQSEEEYEIPEGFPRLAYSKAALRDYSRFNASFISKQTKGVISAAKNRFCIEMLDNPYSGYNLQRPNHCGCNLKLHFGLRCKRYLHMTLREFLRSIWEETKIYMLTQIVDVDLDSKDSQKDIEISRFPNIKYASVELTYGWAEDMVLVLRGVRKGKRNYDDGCNECSRVWAVPQSPNPLSQFRDFPRNVRETETEEDDDLPVPQH
ncbi:hypothetical protein AOL_s00080g332 [Orbilia oligospora ATCC 24927]|uniref:F-box domain-containing protein n=1 Tax=Arthrobotrys oligospora (strain ATCC 24927 / CBS 115.81 / DSM 1491) TaxID=756982 RepID=G1XEU7_ARTOA|nr:hypothetical protein AOL_s00080g332 [Orbilia oligospora ATCC 24927]EGX48362.1 hypothetical protein AOL_s00080g332 [Orbilia oligospora ATCC 24927]